MKLSDTENKTLTKLKKRQQFLRRWRVPLSIFHGVCIVAWLVLLVVVSRFPSGDPTAKLMVVSYLLPPVYVFLALHSLFLGLIIKDWHGDPGVALILKVVDGLQRTNG